MRAVIVVAVIFAILHFGLRYWVTPKFGEDVKARFVERLKYIPSFKAPGDKDGQQDSEAALNEANFAAWLAKTGQSGQPARLRISGAVASRYPVSLRPGKFAGHGLASFGRAGRSVFGLAGLGVVAVSDRLNGVRSFGRYSADSIADRALTFEWRDLSGVERFHQRQARHRGPSLPLKSSCSCWDTRRHVSVLSARKTSARPKSVLRLPVSPTLFRR